MLDRPDRWNKTQFFPNSCCVDTAIWIDNMDANKTYGEKAWRQLHKNAASNIEQVQEATPHKTAAIRPPISKTIQVRRTRLAGHCWRSKDELISDIILWSPLHGRAKAGRPARTYIQKLCADTGHSLEDFPEAIDDRDGSRERAIRAAVRHEYDDAFTKAPALLAPHPSWLGQRDTCWGSLTPLQRCSRCILQPQLTRQRTLVVGVILLCRDVVGVFCNPSWLSQRTLVGGVIPLCRDAVGVFYNPNRLGQLSVEEILLPRYMN